LSEGSLFCRVGPKVSKFWSCT